MSELRVGTRERELAMATLDVHHAEGRLDADEYRERSAAAVAARLRSDLDVLFADLPAPHPDYPAGPVARPVPGDRDAVGTAGGPPGPGTDGRDPTRRPDAPADARRDRGPGAGDDLPELVAPLGAALGRNAGKLSALVPVVAVVLFALTGFRFPVIFLLVPVALGVLGYLGHREGG